MSFFDCLVTSHSALKVHPAAACTRMYSLVEASPASALMPSFPLKLPWQHPEPTPAQRQARTLTRTWPAVPACHGNAASVCCVCLPPHRQTYPLPTRPGTETQPPTHTRPRAQARTCARKQRRKPGLWLRPQDFLPPALPLSHPLSVLGSGAPRAQLPPGAPGPRP